MLFFCVELTFGCEEPDGTECTSGKRVSVIDGILTLFAEKFGGARTYSNRGSYKTKNGEIILGSSTTILSYTKVLGESLLVELILEAYKVAKVLEQESVLLVITESKGDIHSILPDLLRDYIKNN